MAVDLQNANTVPAYATWSEASQCAASSPIEDATTCVRIADSSARSGLTDIAPPSGWLTKDTPSSCTSGTGLGAGVVILTTHSDPVHRGPRNRSNMRVGPYSLASSPGFVRLAGTEAFPRPVVSARRNHKAVAIGIFSSRYPIMNEPSQQSSAPSGPGRSARGVYSAL